MSCVIPALYAIIMVESMTAGIALYFGIQEGLRNIIWVDSEDREWVHIVRFSFFITVFAGYLIALPCLCYAVHKRHSTWLYPYSAWRLFLLILLIGVTIYLCVHHSRLPYSMPNDEYYSYLLIPFAIEVALGSTFFWIALYALRNFQRYRITSIDRLLSR